MKDRQVLAGFGALALAASIATDAFAGFTRQIRNVVKVKARPCLNCGKPNMHNNAWCSPECCKEYRKK